MSIEASAIQKWTHMRHISPDPARFCLCLPTILAHQRHVVDRKRERDGEREREWERKKEEAAKQGKSAFIAAM